MFEVQFHCPIRVDKYIFSLQFADHFSHLEREVVSATHAVFHPGLLVEPRVITRILLRGHLEDRTRLYNIVLCSTCGIIPCDCTIEEHESSFYGLQSRINDIISN